MDPLKVGEHGTSLWELGRGTKMAEGTAESREERVKREEKAQLNFTNGAALRKNGWKSCSCSSHDDEMRGDFQ